MIRYVLAVILTVALLGIAMAAVDAAGSEISERRVQTAISDVEAAADELAADEELSPPGHPNPQRVVELQLPDRSLLTEGVSRFEIEPLHGVDASVVRYALEDGTTGEERIDGRIVYRDPTGNEVTVIGASGRQPLTLVLLPDEDGTPVVVAEPSTP